MNFLDKIKNKKLLVAAALVLGAVLLCFVVLAVFANTYDKIFPRVTADGIALGGMTREAAAEKLEAACTERYTDASVSVKIEDIYTCDISAEELGLSLPTESIVEAAYNSGREGGFFARTFSVLGTLLTGEKLPVEVLLDEVSKENIKAELSAYDIAPVDATYTIEGEELLLHPHTDGLKLDTEALFTTLIKTFSEQNYEEITVSREVDSSVALDMDKVYAEVHKEVADAFLEKVGDENKITPHVVGVDFDLAAAKAAYDADATEVIKIPLKVTQPKVYTKDLEANLFKYCLAEVETHFSPKKVERTANVRLAAKLVNGTVLNPGEEFSYNKVVGPRTAARGFKEAAIYSAGEVVDGIGGGICQVSSTIYMAALRANMKITERTNHAFYVDYTPKGEDATVVYGALDFKFVNTSKYPIKIVATSKNNYIRIKIMGTEGDEKYTVKLTKKTSSTTPYTTREKKTDTLPAGERKVEQKGQEGLSMTVYRNVYDSNGKLVKSYLENNSKYKPMPEIVLVGTGKAPAAPASGEQATPAPAEKPQQQPEPEQEKPTEQTPPPVEEKPAEEAPQPSGQQPTEAPTETPEEKPAEEAAPDWIN